VFNRGLGQDFGQGVMQPRTPLTLSTGTSMTGVEEGAYVPPERPPVIHKPSISVGGLLVVAVLGYLAWDFLT